MTSAFRRRIINKVLIPLKGFVDGPDYFKLSSVLPIALKLCRSEIGPPQFQLSWSKIIGLQPDLEKRVHPDSLFTCLKDQHLPEHEGITDIAYENEPKPNITFSMDQQIFNKVVLRELCHNIDEFPNRSCFFRNIPPENVIVEYSSPNIAKPFHYGHFRSTVIGNFVANLFQYIGHEVRRINYLGDWGLQYGILATGFQDMGSEEKLKEDPLSHLYEVYKYANIKANSDTNFSEKARNHFQMMEEGNSDVLKQWEQFRTLSIEKMNETYKRLGICFDEIHGESLYVDKAKSVCHQLLDNGLAVKESDGAIYIDNGKENTSEEKTFLQKSDGTTLYLTRDVAAAIDRKSCYHFDNMYYVVDSSQSKHFSSLIHVLKCLNYKWSDNIRHVPFGRVLNFSTRKGTAVFLHEILDESQERTLERMENSPTTKVTDNKEEVADVLGISCLIINDLCNHRRKELNFNWEKVLNMTGNSGITLQYCHARLNNIKENCGVELKLNCELDSLLEKEACALVEHLAKFDECLYNSYLDLEPSIVVQYLFRLRQHVGRANKVLTVKGQPLHQARARLFLFHCAQLVLHKGLKILGIMPLSKM